MSRTPTQIQTFLDQNMHRFDLGVQFLGSEPNAVGRPWGDATARWCLVASWPYEAAAGNQSIPAVYKSIHDADPGFLCDRFYLPATPADMRLLEKNNIPIFGIESKHQLTDFDVVATSISYPVLAISFLKMLTMSGIAPRWRDRDPNTNPMVMVGGLSYGAPEVLAPVVDCWFLGEAEDEPGNPGIGAVTTRIAAFKRQGRWATDRLGCYSDLAREFNFLYFPRFVEVRYQYEDRAHVGVTPHASKQVSGYTSLLEGMRLPLRKRHVKNLDSIAPLDNPPLLYADPSMGSGDLEVARGCPAWCSFCSLSFRQKPYRQRSVDYVVEYGKSLQNNLGSTRMAPFSPDLPMYTERRRLIAGLLENVSDEVDAASMRVDDFNADDQFILLQVHGGMDAVSLGVEGNCLHGSTRVQIPAFGVCRIDELLEKDAKEIVVGREKHRLDGASLTGHRSLSRVIFSDGTEILATPEHLIRTLDGRPEDGRVYLTPAQRAELGVTSNYLSKRLQVDQISELWCPLEELTPGMVVRSYYGQMEFPAFSPEGMTADLAWFLGLLSGDGRVEASGIEIRTDDEGVAQQARKVLAALGVRSGERLHPARGRILTAYSRSFAALLAGWGVADTASKRRIPSAIWHSSREVVAAYLTGVLDADGCVPNRSVKSGTTVVHGTHDEVFARELGQLFAAFGHPISLRKNVNRGRTMWHTVLHSAPDVDWSWLAFAETTRKEMLARALQREGQRLGQVTWRSGDNGLKYVTVKSVEHDVVSANVYDLHVPGAEAFTANGVVVHNSQRMRDLIGKGTSDADVKEAVTRGIRAGIRKFKLFMISNLPGEDEGDVYRILKLAKDLADIRDSMGQSTVRIQFSWTPLMIEANTPFQWFATQPASRILGDVWEEFRDLKIDFKIGSKSEANKLAFFQLSQRASRDVGEAIVDAMLEADQACWGGVPRTFKDNLENKLHRWGFDNGFADCFDERYKADLFGWEFIDTGVSNELLWSTYVQMREFVEYTDSHSYDLNFDDSYHGSEWVSRCDSRCSGKSCGACDHADLKLRTGYIRAVDADVDLTSIRSVDQHSQAVRIRAKIHKPESLRFVGNDHWRFLFRRACFRAQTSLGLEHGIAKRSIRFASDEVKYRDWTAGTDYVEFAFTRPMTDPQIVGFVHNINKHLDSRMTVSDFKRHPVDAVTIRTDVDLTLFEVELDADLDLVNQRLTWWNTQDIIIMRLKVEGGYFAPASEQVNAKDYVDDLWIRLDGHRLYLRMMLHGRPNPYNITAALMGKQSWLPYAKHAATRVDTFIATDRHQNDFLRPNCTRCGLGIPITLLDQPYHPAYCPRCLDEQDPST